MSIRRQIKNVTYCSMSSSTRARRRDKSKRSTRGLRGSANLRSSRCMSRIIQIISNKRILSSFLVGSEPSKAFTSRRHLHWSLSRALVQPSRRSSTSIMRPWMEPLSPSNNMRPRTSKSKSWNKSWISRISCNIRIKRNLKSLARRASTKFITRILRMSTHTSLHTWPLRSFKPVRRTRKGSDTTTEEAVATSGTIVETTTAVANKTMVAEEDTSNNHLCLYLHSQWWWALASKCTAILNSSTCNRPHTKWTWCLLHKWCSRYIHKEVTLLVSNLHSQECTRQISRYNKIPCILRRCKISMR